jgi:hypothetical protein
MVQHILQFIFLSTQISTENLLTTAYTPPCQFKIPMRGIECYGK